MPSLHPIMEHIVQRPCAALAAYVRTYVGYRYVGFPAGLHRGLPSRHLTFIISLDRPVEMYLSPGEGAPVDRQRRALQAFVGGLQTWPAHILHDGSQYGLSVEVTPLGCGALLGVPGGELAGRVVTLEDVMGARGRLLLERLVDARSWRERFQILDAILAGGLAERRAASLEVAHVWDRLVRQAGHLDIQSLAHEVGWSRRHLTEQVRRQVGLPPRQLARMLRFERSRSLLQRRVGSPVADSATLTDVALDAGYFDHAHMDHEWRRLAGCPPSEWLREVLPPVQDDVPPEASH